MPRKRKPPMVLLLEEDSRDNYDWSDLFRPIKPPPYRRWWRQFSLRTLVIAMFVLPPLIAVLWDCKDVLLEPIVDSYRNAVRLPAVLWHYRNAIVHVAVVVVLTGCLPRAFWRKR